MSAPSSKQPSSSGAIRLEHATHELKTWPAYFKDVLRGDKTFEVRRDDRTPMFKVGDTLILREWDERNGYSGDKLWRRVTYVLPGDQFGIEKGYVVLGLGMDS